MLHRLLATAIAAACLVLALGCGTEDLPSPGSDDYLPLAVGNYWKYQETGYDEDSPAASRIIGHEVVDYVEMDFEHDAEGALPVFVVEDSFPAPSEPGADDPRLEFLHDDGTLVARMRQEVYDRNTDALKKARDYEPGLLRFDRNRTTTGDEWNEYYMTYTVSIPGEPDDGEADTEYLYEILEPETVTVPVGTFDCLVMQRKVADGSVYEVKVYYFAPGVGKVMEITTPTGGTVKTEELVEFNIVPAADGGV